MATARAAVSVNDGSDSPPPMTTTAQLLTDISALASTHERQTPSFLRMSASAIRIRALLVQARMQLSALPRPQFCIRNVT